MADKSEALILLSPGFPANEQDTACLPAHQVFVRAVSKNFPGLSIIVIAFQYPAEVAEYKWNNVTIISLNGNRYRKASRLLAWAGAWNILKKLHKQYYIRGLLSFWISECAVIGSYFGKQHGIKHYCWMIGRDAQKGNRYVKWMRPQPGEIIAISDFVAELLYSNYNIKTPVVIPNCVDTSLFEPAAKKRSIDILGAGSLIPLKQYDVFVETVKLMHNSMPRLHAVLCGKGPEEDALKELIQQVGLTNHIHLTGEKPHTEVLALMQQCKIFLHTSNYEGFSTVCLEALYAGAHVISFFSPMHERYGHWHIVDTKEAMAVKALELLADERTEYTPVLPYTSDDIAGRVMQLFD